MKNDSNKKVMKAKKPTTPSTIKTKVFGSEKKARGPINKEAAKEDAGEL